LRARGALSLGSVDEASLKAARWVVVSSRESCVDFGLVCGSLGQPGYTFSRVRNQDAETVGQREWRDNCTRDISTGVRALDEGWSRRGTAPGEHSQEVFVSVKLTVCLEQSEYVIRCPDGAQLHTEEGNPYVVVPSPFEVDEPGERLWLNSVLLIEKARAGAWGFFLVSETVLEESARPAWQRRPPVILNGHKQIDPRGRKRAFTPLSTK